MSAWAKKKGIVKSVVAELQANHKHACPRHSLLSIDLAAEEEVSGGEAHNPAECHHRGQEVEEAGPEPAPCLADVPEADEVSAPAPDRPLQVLDSGDRGQETRDCVGHADLLDTLGHT